MNGSSQLQQESADGRHNAWPAWLAKILRDEWGERVKVTNLCERGVGTEYWVAEVLRRGGTTRSAVARADIVLVDTASNDGFEHGAEAYTRPVENTELLLHSLLSLPRRPFAMWVTAYWRDFAHQAHSSAEAAHLSVLAPADVPHTSLARMFGPVRHDAELAQWLTQIYYQDCCHPSLYGQKLIAAVVARRLLKQLQVPADLSVASSFPVPMAPSPPHAALAAHHQALAAPAAATSFDWTYSREGEVTPVVHSVGFEQTADHAGKLGFVSTQLGSHLVLRLPPHTTRVLLGMLHSYEGVGAIALELLHHQTAREAAADDKAACGVWETANGTAVPLPALNGPKPPSPVLDTRWPLHASVHHFVDAAVPDELVKPCMWLRGTAVEAAPQRRTHKLFLQTPTLIRTHKLKLLNMVTFGLSEKF